MKRLKAAATVAALSMIPWQNTAHATGVPTVDAAAIAEEIRQHAVEMAEEARQHIEELAQEAQHHARELAEMINQLNEMRAQTQELVRQYQEQVRLFNSIASIRSFGDVFKVFARVNNQLEYGSLGNLIEATTGEEVSIPGEIADAMGGLRQLYNLDGLKDFATTGRLRNETAADLGKFGLILASLGEQGMNAHQERTERTNALRDQVGQQEDLKAAVDFNTGVQVEILQALNELNMRLSSMASLEGRQAIESVKGRIRTEAFIDANADTELQ